MSQATIIVLLWIHSIGLPDLTASAVGGGAGIGALADGSIMTAPFRALSRQLAILAPCHLPRHDLPPSYRAVTRQRPWASSSSVAGAALIEAVVARDSPVQLGEEPMKRLLGALVLSLLTSGCAYDYRGAHFDPAAVAQLQPGISTERDAIDKLGSPLADVFNYAGGSKLLQWHYVRGYPIGTSSEAATAIVFDGDGKMVRVVLLSQQSVERWWNQ